MRLILEKLKEYLDIPAVTNFSEPFLKYLYKDFSKFSDYELILSKNLLVVRKKENRSNKFFSAHIDRLGLVLSSKGVEHSNFWGKREYNIKIETGLEIFDRMAIAFNEEHFIPYNEIYDELRKYTNVKVKYVKTDFVKYFMEFIFYNNNNNFKGKKNLAFMLENNFFFDGKFIGGQIDNAISVACLYKLIKDGFDGTVLFTCREEIGLSWKYIEEYFKEENLNVKNLIVLDTTPYPSSSDFENGKIIFRRADSNGKFNIAFIDKLKAYAKDQEIPYAIKVPRGKTELGRLVEFTNGNFNGATIQIPSTNYHSNKEMTNVKCLKNYYKFIKLISNKEELFH